MKTSAFHLARMLRAMNVEDPDGWFKQLRASGLAAGRTRDGHYVEISTRRARGFIMDVRCHGHRNILRLIHHRRGDSPRAWGLTNDWCNTDEVYLLPLAAVYAALEHDTHPNGKLLRKGLAPFFFTSPQAKGDP